MKGRSRCTLASPLQEHREAVEMINCYKRKQAIKKAEKIYKEIKADDKRLAEEFLSICAEGNSSKPWFEGVLEVKDL